MMDGQYLLFDKIEVFELKNGDCYIRNGQHYFFKESYFASKRYKPTSICKVKWQWFDFVCMFLVVCSVGLLVEMYLKAGTFMISPFNNASTVGISFSFLLANVVFHEFGHALFLKIWHRKVGKVHVTFRYVFPMITVDTSDSYLLSKFRRCCVSYAGVLVNVYLCSIVVLCFPNYSFVIPQVLTMVLFCLIPIGGLRNDGYHILFSTILNVNSTAKKRTAIDYIGSVAIYAFVLYSLYSRLFR